MSKHRSKIISACLKRFLKVLAKPQQPHFLIYLTGLISLVKFRSIREIADHFGGANTDGLHHFIKNAPRIAAKLGQTITQCCQVVFKDYPNALLILDDTLAPRKGKNIQGLGLHHSSQGLTKGLCVVTAILKAGPLSLVFALRGYKPRKVCAPGTFKSKVTLALEILGEAFLLFPRGLTVVMDTWYGCAPILNTIQEAGGIFVAALKQNRYVFLNRIKISVSLLAKRRMVYSRVRGSGKKYFKIASQIVWLSGVGQIKLFISRTGGYRFFVTNNLEMTESEMVKIYTQRFSIETFHKDIKQHLGFGEMFMRSWDGVQTHWTILAVAYNLVVLSAKPRLKSFRQKIRHFRSTVGHETILKCLLN